MVEQIEVVFFEHGLNGASEIDVMLLKFTAGNARGTERFGHFVGISGAESWLTAIPAHVDALGVMDEVIEIETALIAGGSNDIADLLDEARLAIGGEAHHLVLITVLGE